MTLAPSPETGGLAQAIPSVLFLGTILMIPESPRWLILKKGLVDAARKTLNIIDAATAEQVIKIFKQIPTHMHQAVLLIYFKKSIKRPSH